MAPESFGKEIEVTLSGELRIPVSFRLDGQHYEILEILDTWPDYGFGRAPLSRKRWWNRRHRNYYRIKSDDDGIYEIYHDRGTSLEKSREGRWYLYRRVSGARQPSVERRA